MEKILELKNICKSYGEGKLALPVLFDINLSVERGEYLAIMGPSGSGKSTLMNIIGCLDIASSGSYSLNGHEVEKMTENEISELRNRSIGFVFQNFNLMPRESALENVCLPMIYANIKRKDRIQRAKKALEAVGLADRMDFFPTQLSGGQKQRVAIARAMVMNPKILLADEPTGALDSVSGKQVMELFEKLNEEGVTIIMITHDPQIAAWGKRQVLIRDGRLKEKWDEDAEEFSN